MKSNIGIQLTNQDRKWMRLSRYKLRLRWEVGDTGFETSEQTGKRRGWEVEFFRNMKFICEAQTLNVKGFQPLFPSPPHPPQPMWKKVHLLMS